MKTVLIAFAVLLLILTLISAFGGSLNHEGFEEETFPLIQNDEQEPKQTSENFWEEQQQALVEQFAEETATTASAVEPVDQKEQKQEAVPVTSAEHVQENFASCGNYKEDFANAEDIEPYEDEKTYGAF